MNESSAHDWEIATGITVRWNRLRSKEAMSKAIAQALADRYAAGRDEERERCAKAMCTACRRGEHAEFQEDPTPMWWHGSRECYAAALHAAGAPAERGKS